MIEAAIVGGLLALGVVILLRGLNPSDATLQERIYNLSLPPEEDAFAPIDPGNFDELRQQVSIRLLQMTAGDKMGDIQSNVAAARTDLDRFAMDKLYAGIGVGIMSIFLGMQFGLVSTVIGAVVVAVAGAALGYNLPDIDIRTKAKKGRAEFEVALNAFVGLVGVSMSGGGGLNTAMMDAATVGRGWVFELLRETLQESQVRNEPAWRGLDRLGRRLQVEGLIELAGSIGLAGDSGARVTETLVARAESGRKRMIAEARSQAEERTANLGIPIGALLLGWVGFLGYPAVVNLISGLT